MQWRRDPRGTGALYVLAGTFLWCAVLLLVVTFGFLFRSDGHGSGSMGPGIVIGVLTWMVAAVCLLGIVLALVATWFSRDRRRLWPLWLPILLIALHALLIVFMEAIPGRGYRGFAEERLLLMGHVLGYVSIAVLAGLWISRFNAIAALVAGILFVGALARHDLAQYWVLGELAKLESRPGDSVRLDDYRVIVPGWLAALTGSRQVTYRLQAELTPMDAFEAPRALVSLSPRIFGASATGYAYVALSMADGREAELTLPDFVQVAGPGRISGGCPNRKRSWCGPSIFEGRYMSSPRWLRADQPNLIRCNVAERPAPSACTIASSLP